MTSSEEMQVKRLMNRVSVDAAFFKKLSPMENLVFAARILSLDGGTAKRDALVIVERLGIGAKRVGRPIEQMSRGMQQKVAIARALLTSPFLVLLDEPTTGLDPRSSSTCQSFIEELRASHDATVVLTTHRRSTWPRRSASAATSRSSTPAASSPRTPRKASRPWSANDWAERPPSKTYS